MKKPFTAILLSGGKSKRMGEDKAQLTYRNSTFLRIQADKLRLTGASQLLLSSDYCTLFGWETVKDVYENMGPICGIYSAMLKSKNDTCLVLSIDSVGVTENILSGLLEIHFESGNDITLLRNNNGEIEPLIGIYEKSLLNELRISVEQDKLKITRLISDLENEGKITVGYFDIESPIITNCNTRQDYEEIAGM